jgi:hypothetical protein
MEKEHTELGHDQLRKQPSKANWLKEQQSSPEHIGHTLITAETKPDNAAAKRLSGKRIETLNRAQLLELSEKIIIDGSSLRQIYETHLIGERGLRRLAAEYIQGGDLKQALRQEIIERERDFERDPAMRDKLPDSPMSSDDDALTRQSAKSALDELLDKVDIAPGTQKEETAFFKARARYEAQELHLHKQQRRIIDISLGTIILILLALVIFLFMKRG